MKEIALSDALDTLANAFGPTLATTRNRGLELMREALEKEHDLAHDVASDMLDALQESGRLVWSTRGPSAIGPRSLATFGERPLATTAQNAPGVVPVESGHWRIGGPGTAAR